MFSKHLDCLYQNVETFSMKDLNKKNLLNFIRSNMVWFFFCSDFAPALTCISRRCSQPNWWTENIFSASQNSVSYTALCFYTASFFFSVFYWIFFFGDFNNFLQKFLFCKSLLLIKFQHFGRHTIKAFWKHFSKGKINFI